MWGGSITKKIIHIIFGWVQQNQGKKYLWFSLFLFHGVCYLCIWLKMWKYPDEKYYSVYYLYFAELRSSPINRMIPLKEYSHSTTIQRQMKRKSTQRAYPETNKKWIEDWPWSLEDDFKFCPCQILGVWSCGQVI